MKIHSCNCSEKYMVWLWQTSSEGNGNFLLTSTSIFKTTGQKYDLIDFYL